MTDDLPASSIWPAGTEQVLLAALREARHAKTRSAQTLSEALLELTPEEIASTTLSVLGEIVHREFVSREAVRQAEATMTSKAAVVASVWGEDGESVLVLRACAERVHEILEPPVLSPEQAEVMQWLQEQGLIEKSS